MRARQPAGTGRPAAGGLLGTPSCASTQLSVAPKTAAVPGEQILGTQRGSGPGAGARALGTRSGGSPAPGAAGGVCKRFRTC